MTEQVEQNNEQATNESKSVADMTPEELAAEIERVDQELAKSAEPPREPSEARGRPPSTNSGETLAREAQAARRDLIRQYESLDSDERYTDEHRASRVWEAYDKAKPLIEQKAKAAREKLLKSADEYEMSSIPFPAGQSLRTNDVQLLSLSQGERARLVQRLSYENPTVARMRAAGKNVPTSAEDRPANILREEYARGLDIGGPQGGAICRAVIGLAEDRGMSVDDIVDEHRRDWQRTYLQNAQDARIQASSVYSRVPLPSSPRPGGAKSPEEARAGKRRTPFGALKKASGAGPAFQKKNRKPHWK
jgi:hypothetical protein